ALRAGLDPGETPGDGEVDGLIVAAFEMEKRVILDGAPVAAEKRIAADEVERPRDRASAALGQHQKDIVAHRGLDFVEKGAGEVGPAPFAAAGVLVEGPEGIPVTGQ